jgi:hypothetical protein
MTGPAANPRPGAGKHPPSLAQRSFPRRVRAILEGILEYVSDEMERGLNAALNETEQHLFKLAEQARSDAVQKQCFESLGVIRRGRADLVPRFMLELEASLARLQDPRENRSVSLSSLDFSQLSLVEDVQMDEDVVVKEIAARTEVRSSLALFLLGQRFGVLAGRPAFDAEHLPVGPYALCEALRRACRGMDLGTEHLQLLFRQFDRLVMQFLATFYDAINAYLIKQGVLPGLTFVPVRARPVARPPSPEEVAAAEAKRGKAPPAAAVPPAAPAAPRRKTDAADKPALPSVAAIAAALQAGHPPEAPAGPQPLTAWPGTATTAEAAGGEQDQELFGILRGLLAGRRSLLGKFGGGEAGARKANSFVPSTQDLQSVLGNLQRRPPAPVLVDGKPAQRSVAHLKQDLLAQLRQLGPEGKAPALSEADADAIDLVGMLFEHLMRDVRPNSPAADLLVRLQAPLLRVALGDHGFFTRRQHPARQMLNAIAETGAYWSGEDEADRDLLDKLRLLVERVSGEFDGDSGIFENLLGDLSQHLQLQARKAEVAERRHVEAARGKEKLELARVHAAEAIDAKLAGKRIPKFLHTLLAQAWSDVLSLTILRQGEDSEAFRHELRIAERLIESAVAQRSTGKPLLAPAETQSLRAEVEQSLLKVGYHAEDAQAVATRLMASPDDEEESDPASRTELAMRLKARTRLGQGTEAAVGAGDKLAPLSAEEQQALERIRQAPFGTWFEFTVNQQGDHARRRMSWFSPVTGHALFVNHRGQRIGEYSINWLAREMNRGNVRIVEAERGSLVDRAWNAILNALKAFTGQRDEAGQHSGSQA